MYTMTKNVQQIVQQNNTTHNFLINYRPTYTISNNYFPLIADTVPFTSAYIKELKKTEY